MKRILSSPSGRITAALGLLLVGLLVVLVIRQPSLLVPLLITLAVVGLAWWVTELVLRRRQRKRQADFDERLAAREGIEDRRREWSEWTRELERQNIDRYDLPFYLLVGEPQAGKSVLLQNSDLHFPFGQSRLSGIGGTKGCDWWFTDEAVVLDLAGRLFVHEGGAADEAEWKAFLDLLVGFRPMCPANGILLVVPCNSLLEDSEEKSLAAAKRIQGALTTLTQSLQAELPVYLVLTKADRVFGFAESVHRLEVDERHQMFGWSRPADKAETAFSLDEARAGFDEMVGRARNLRTQMMATARLPEALPEVDRLFAFPDELANLYPALEIYLRQIFTETTLLDRLFFRGIYLTSGLQTGVPIAKVCRDMLGATGEADRRELETVFTKQRAYFIKDLVRKRVFAEQGLVRPTERRALRARKNSVIGYGIAAVLAIVSVTASLMYLFGGAQETVAGVDGMALADAELARPNSAMPVLLDALYAQTRAVAQDRQALEKTVSDRVPEEFERLYVALFDNYLLPSIREKAGTVVAARAGDPRDFADLQAWAEDAGLLLNQIEAGDPVTYARLCAIAKLDETELSPKAKTSGVTFGLTEAFAYRKGLGSIAPLEPFSGEPAQTIRAELTPHLDGALDPQTEWTVGEDLGYLIAWKVLAKEAATLRDPATRDGTGVHESCARYSAAVEHLGACMSELVSDETNFRLRPAAARQQLDDLQALRGRLLRAQAPGSWKSADELRAHSFGRRELLSKTAEAPESGSLPVPPPGVSELVPPPLVHVADPELLPLALARVGGLPEQLKEERELRERRPPEAIGLSEQQADEVFFAKLLAVNDLLVVELKRWEKLAETLRPEEGETRAAPLRTELVQHLLDLGGELRALDPEQEKEFGNWIASIDTMLADYLEAWEDDGLQVRNTDEPGVLDWEAVNVLARVESEGGQRARSDVRRLLDASVDQQQNAALDAWDAERNPGRAPTEILAVLEKLTSYEVELSAPGPNGTERIDQRLLSAWLEQVDELLAGRLDDYRTNLVNSWEVPDMSATLSLEVVAQRVLDHLAKQALVQKIKAPGAPRELKRDQDKLCDQPLPFEEQLPKLAQARATFGPERVPWDDKVDKRTAEEAERFCSFVEAYASASGADRRGPALAQELAEERKRAPALEPNALNGFVTDVRTAFLERMQTEVRQRYLEDLERDILNAHRDLIDALYETDPERLAQLDNKKLVSQLSDLMDAGGALEVLRKNYALGTQPAAPDAGPESSSDFRPDPAELGDEGDGGAKVWKLDEQRLWRFDRFLGGLQDFLRVAGNRRVADCEFTLFIQPAGAVPETIWDKRYTQGGMLHFYPAANLRGELGSSQLIGPNMSAGPELLCSFDRNDSYRLRMRWSPVVGDGKGEARPEDLHYEVSSALGPLLFLWNGALTEEPEDPSKPTWDVEVTPPASTYEAPFTARIDAKVQPPERPEDPRRDQ